jgi:hypothetical protein
VIVSTPEEFPMRIWQIFDDASPHVDISDISRELAAHGEPTEGLIYLAWCIADQHAIVPTHVVLDILDIVTESGQESDLPPGFGLRTIS